MRSRAPATSVPPAGSREMTSTVSSPATVPRIEDQAAWSTAEAEELGRARGGAQHHQVRAGLRAEQELGGDAGQPARRVAVRDVAGPGGPGRLVLAAGQAGQVPGQPAGPRSGPARLAGQGVDQCPVGRAQADRAELVQVTGQGGLGHPHPALGEQLGQFLLGPDRGPGQDAGDLGLPGGLGDRADRRHEDRSSSQASSAFWACSRFSASSQTTLCGPSITAAVISSPRCAGRQCSTTQPGPARPSFSSSSW